MTNKLNHTNQPAPDGKIVLTLSPIDPSYGLVEY
jgi:hypothetical protein